MSGAQDREVISISSAERYPDKYLSRLYRFSFTFTLYGKHCCSNPPDIEPKLTMQSPLEITETKPYWLRSRDVSDSPKIGGDDYFSEHDVTRPEDVGSDDLPPADNEAVREIDREALEQNKTIGKWQVTRSADRIE